MPDALWLLTYAAGPLIVLGVVVEVSARALGLGSARRAFAQLRARLWFLWIEHLSARRNHFWFEGYRGGYADANRTASIEREALKQAHEHQLAERMTQAYACGFDEGRRIATMRAISTQPEKERWN